MGEYENEAVVGETKLAGVSNELPAQVSVWTKIKNYLFQDIVLTMTPKQEKVLQEVHDFWHQKVDRDFWFQKIEIIDNITL